VSLGRASRARAVTRDDNDDKVHIEARMTAGEGGERTSRPLHGKVAVVTGSTQGLGLAIASALGAAGSHVVLHGLATERDVASARRDIEQRHGVRTAFSNANLKDRTAIEDLFTAVARDLGECDIW
jgi:3-hydroxybutyrate dehydrogenase